MNTEEQQTDIEIQTREGYLDGLKALKEVAENGKDDKDKIEAVRGLFAAYDMVIRNQEMAEIAERVNEKGADVIAQVKKLKNRDDKPWNRLGDGDGTDV